MKIAVCISGQMRNFHTTIESLKKYLLDLHDCDLFIATWTDSGISTDVGRLFPKGVGEYFSNQLENDSKYFISKYSVLVPDFIEKKCVLPSDLKIYPNLKSYIIEDMPDNYESDKVLGGVYYPNVLQKSYPRRYHNLSMFYKINQCNDLKRDYEKKYNIKYDLVVRIRPDLILLENLIPKIYNPDNLYIKEGMTKKNYIFDQCFYANSSLMDIVCGLWNSLEKYWDIRYNKNWPISDRTNGDLIYHHLVLNDISTFQQSFKTSLKSDVFNTATDLNIFINKVNIGLRKNQLILDSNLINSLYSGISELAISTLRKNKEAALKILTNHYTIANTSISSPSFGLGFFYSQEKNWDEAIRHLNAAYINEPGKSKIEKHLLAALFEKGLKNRINLIINDALEKGRYKNIDLYILYLQKLKKNKDIIKTYETINHQYSPGSLYRIGLCYYSEEKLDKSLEILNKIKPSNKKNYSLALYKRAQIYEKNKNFTLSYLNVSYAIVLDPSREGLYLFKYELLLNNKKLDIYLSELNREKIVTLPSNLTNHLYTRFYFENGDTKKFLYYYEKQGSRFRDIKRHLKMPTFYNNLTKQSKGLI